MRRKAPDQIRPSLKWMWYIYAISEEPVCKIRLAHPVVWVALPVYVVVLFILEVWLLSKEYFRGIAKSVTVW